MDSTHSFITNTPIQTKNNLRIAFNLKKLKTFRILLPYGIEGTRLQPVCGCFNHSHTHLAKVSIVSFSENCFAKKMVGVPNMWVSPFQFATEASQQNSNRFIFVSNRGHATALISYSSVTDHHTTLPLES